MLCISIYNYIIMYLELKQKNKTFNVKIILTFYEIQTPTEKDEMGQHDLNFLRYHNGYEILLQFYLNPGFLIKIMQSLHGYFNTIYGYICLPGACL